MATIPSKRIVPGSPVIGLEVILVLGRHLDRPAERRLLILAGDEDDAVLDQRHRSGIAGEVGVSQLDGEPARWLDDGLVGMPRGSSDHRLRRPTTVCDCSRRNCWT